MTGTGPGSRFDGVQAACCRRPCSEEFWAQVAWSESKVDRKKFGGWKWRMPFFKVRTSPPLLTSPKPTASFSPMTRPRRLCLDILKIALFPLSGTTWADPGT